MSNLPAQEVINAVWLIIKELFQQPLFTSFFLLICVLGAIYLIFSFVYHR